jgi:phosphonate transport system substrate-binding protein
MMTTVRATIHFANFLSPLMQETYEYISHLLSIRIGRPVELHTSQCLSEFVLGQADVGFLCGLLYVHASEMTDCPFELLAAPVLAGARYQSLPIYFSDVVVRKDSPYASFADLEGCIWAYNEGASHSGCNLVNYTLLKRQLSPNYFGRRVKSGSHLNSLRMVLNGEADAAAIDSHVLALALRRDAQLAARLRIIEALGPSAIPPVVVARDLEPAIKRSLLEFLTTMHCDPFSARILLEGGIERFVPVCNEHYDDIRTMLAHVQATNFSHAFV